jgi:hypothetical protein
VLVALLPVHRSDGTMLPFAGLLHVPAGYCLGVLRVCMVTILLLST